MITRIISPLRAFNPQARIFFAVIVGLSLVVDGLYSVLLNLYLLRLEYGTEFIGLVNAVGMLTFGLASLPAGILGSRLSTTGLMKFGVFVSLVGGLLLPLAESLPPGWREAGLVITPALMFGGFAFFFVNGAPFLINVVDDAYKNHAFALKAAHWSLAGFAGSLIGGLLPGAIAGMNNWTLNDPEPFRTTFALATVVLALSAALIAAPTPSAAESEAHVTRERQGSRSRPQWLGKFDPDADRRNDRDPPLPSRGLGHGDGLFQCLHGSAFGGIDRADRHYGRHRPPNRRTDRSAYALSGSALGQRPGRDRVIDGGYALPNSAGAGGALVGGLFWIYRRDQYDVRTLYRLRRLHARPGAAAQQSVMAGSGEAAAGLSFAMMALGGGLLLTAFTFRDLFLLGALVSFIGTVAFWLYVLVTKPKRKLAPV